MSKTLLSLTTLALVLCALPCKAAGKKSHTAPQNPDWIYLSSEKDADSYLAKQTERSGDIVSFAHLLQYRKPIVGAFDEGPVKSMVFISVANCASGLHRPKRVAMTDGSFATGNVVRDGGNDDASQWKTPPKGSSLAAAVKLACQSS
jgi:hypothetical protein